MQSEEAVQKDKRTILKVTLSNGKKLTLLWSYKEHGSKKHTLVQVIEGHEYNDETKPLFTAKAYLHKGDTFSKNIGRVRSMGKVLEGLFPFDNPVVEGQTFVPMDAETKAANKACRMEIWAAYKKWRNGNIVDGSKMSKLRRRIKELSQLIPKEVVQKEAFEAEVHSL